jgi:putative oxidoreductase
LSLFFTVHISKGFFNQNSGYEYNLVLAAAALTLAFTGPGSLSIDALLNYSYAGWFWGPGALLIGTIAGIAALVERKTVAIVETTDTK